MITITNYIEWIDPYPPLDEPIIQRITEKQAIEFSRKACQKHNVPIPSDRDLLLDFIAVNWANRITEIKVCNRTN